MYKLILPGILSVFIIVACHKKAVPVITARTEQPPPPPMPPKAEVVGTNVEMGRAIYTISCARCHPAKPVANWTASEWKPILGAMIPKAKLDSTQASLVTAYVMANARQQ